MEKIVENAEKYNYKAFLVNLGILGLLTLSMLFDMFGILKHMTVGMFFKFIGMIVSTIIGGTVALATVHMILWCACNHYRKVTGSSPAPESAGEPAPVKAEEKPAEEPKKED